MDNKNVFVAIALSMAVLLFWGAFFETPRQVKENQNPNNVQTNQNKIQNDITPNINQEKIVKKVSRKDALTEVNRVIIENEKVKGSISLKGAIFDDLSFKNYKKDLKSEDNVILLNPKNEEPVYLLALLKIKQSDYKKSKELINILSKICKNFCSKENELNGKLKNLQPK